MHHQWYESENFTNINILLKDCSERFSNWSNIDEMVISSMSGCNCKIVNLIITYIA